MLQKKGAHLENALRLVEEFCIKKPFKEQYKYNLEIRKKRMGGRYEVDLVVTFFIDELYEAKYIFECKNWETKKVDPKEVIHLADKVKKEKAAQGFIVAKEWTKHAETEAKEKNIKLIKFKNIDFEKIEEHMILYEFGEYRYMIFIDDNEEQLITNLDESKVEIYSKGRRISIKEYINKLKPAMESYIDKSSESLKVARLNLSNKEGWKSLNNKQKISPKSIDIEKLLINSKIINEVVIDIWINIWMSKSVIEWAFDIEGRGICIQQRSNYPDGEAMYFKLFKEIKSSIN